MRRSVRIFAFVFVMLVYSIVLFAQTGPISGTIILPDPEITIEDKSKIDFIETGESVLTDTGLNLSGIDLEELATSRISEKIQNLLISDFDGGSNKSQALTSLSYFKLFYGRYDNLLIDFNLGKSAGPLNYLITYLRNKKSSAGMGTNTFFNTEMTVDDLNAGFLFSISDKLDLNLNLGFYERNNGLYTSPVFLSEQKMIVPIKADMTYHIDMVSRLKAQIFYQGLWLSHQSVSNTVGSVFSETGVNLFFQSNYSKDNFLKLTAEYLMFSRETNRIHEVGISALDRFPILKGVSLEVGAHLYFFSQKPFFWFPDASLNLQISNFMSIRAGVTGKMEIFSITEIIGNNQLDYALVDPDERWTLFAVIDIFPFKGSKLGLSGGYHFYEHLLNWSYSPATALYTPYAFTNVQVAELKASFEMMIGDNFMLNLFYEYRTTANTNLLLFYNHTGALTVTYSNPKWGFDVQTKAVYRGETELIDGTKAPSAVLWDLTLSQALNKEIFLQMDFKNLLNIESYEKLYMPGSGFTYHFGIKILL